MRVYRRTLVAALRIAAEQYVRDAEACETPRPMANFYRRADHARKIADAMEAGDAILLED